MASRSTLHDIRVWAKENGWPEISDSGPLPPGARRAYDASKTVEAEADYSTQDSQPGAQTTVDSDTEKPREEKPPQMADVTPIGKAKSFLDRARERASVDKGIAARRSKDRKPRTSVERLIGRGWEMLSRLANPVNPPVARVLAFQAPVAGMLLDEIVKDTVVDTVLQPIVRAEEKMELAFALIGPPLIVGALTVRPEAQPVLIPLLKESLVTWLEVAGDKIEAAKKKDEEFKAKYGDSIDEMINAIFAAPPEPGDDPTN